MMSQSGPRLRGVKISSSRILFGGKMLICSMAMEMGVLFPEAMDLEQAIIPAPHQTHTPHASLPPDHSCSIPHISSQSHKSTLNHPSNQGTLPGFCEYAEMG